jgi:hypothetical protein
MRRVVTEGGPTTAEAHRAWSSFDREGLVRQAALTRPEVTLIPSDPVDGMWVTAAATLVQGPRRHVGFSTAHEVDDRLVARAVGEAVERTLWWEALHAPHPPDVPAVTVDGRNDLTTVGAQVIRGWRPGDAGPFLAEATTTGSAVHDSPAEAVARAAREVVERGTVLRLFHARTLGTPQDVSSRDDLPGARLRAWRHEPSGVVTAAALTPGSAPRLSMGAVAATRDDPTHVAVGKCLAEIAQVRAYARHVARGRPAGVPMEAVTDTDSRILFWSTCAPDLAVRVWDELVDGRPADVGLADLPSELALVDAAVVHLADGTVQYYARAAETTKPYAVHRSDREHEVWRTTRAATPFAPVPLL